MAEPVLLAPKLDVAAASDLLSALRENKDTELVVDMSQVKMLGALCLQVLLSAAITARDENRTMTITNVSERVIDQMRLMGMTPETIARGNA